MKRVLCAALSAVFVTVLLSGLFEGRAAAAPHVAERKRIVYTGSDTSLQLTPKEADKLISNRIREVDDEMLEHVGRVYMSPKRIGKMYFFFPREVREAQQGKIYRNTYHVDLDREGHPIMIYTTTDDKTEALDRYVMSMLWDTSYVPARTMSGRAILSTLSLDIFFAFRPLDASVKGERELYGTIANVPQQDLTSAVRLSGESMQGLMREFYTRAPREDFFSVFLLQVDNEGSVKSARVVVRSQDEEMGKVFYPHIFDALLAWKFEPVRDAKGDADDRLVPVYAFVPAASESDMPDILWLEYMSLWEQ